MFLSRWPDLFKEGRVFSIETPLFVATKKGKETLYFYSFEDYENNKSKLSSYDVTYIKGLGSLDRNSYAETVIKNPKLIQITLDDLDKLDMIFNNKRADDRKKWMMS